MQKNIFAYLLIIASVLGPCKVYAASDRTNDPSEHESGNQLGNQFSKHAGKSAMNLTPNEEEISKKLGYSEAALALIKVALKPEMATVRIGGLEDPDTSFVETRGTLQPLLDEDREEYHKIAAAYPELKQIITPPLDCDSGQFSGEPIEDINPEINRMHRVSEATRKYSPLMSQRMLDHPPSAGRAIAVAWGSTTTLSTESDINGAAHSVMHTVTEGWPPPGMKIFKTDQEAEEHIREIDKRYAGQKLRPENQGKLYLGVRYYSTDASDPPADPRIPALREQLAKLGYRIVEVGCFDRKVFFKSKSAAEAFLQEYGLAQDATSLEEQKPRQMNVIYPIDWQKDLANIDDARTIVQQNPYLGAANDASLGDTLATLKEQMKLAKFEPSSYFVPYPGAKITKLGPRKWRMDIPERCSATVVMHGAIVIKSEPGPGYELLRVRQTSGMSRTADAMQFLDTKQIITQLRMWDDKYGITIIDAGSSDATIRFANLPENLKPLLSEIFLFCPNSSVDQHAGTTATDKNDFAETLRRTKQVRLSWK